MIYDTDGGGKAKRRGHASKSPVNKELCCSRSQATAKSEESLKEATQKEHPGAANDIRDGPGQKKSAAASQGEDGSGPRNLSA